MYTLGSFFALCLSRKKKPQLRVGAHTRSHDLFYVDFFCGEGVRVAFLGKAPKNNTLAKLSNYGVPQISCLSEFSP